MVPAGDIADKSIKALAEVIEAGDMIIDGGNSHYRDDIVAPTSWPRRGSTTSTAAPAAAYGGSSAATA